VPRWRTALLAAVAGFCFALPAIEAPASDRFGASLQVNFLPGKPGSSSGLHTLISWSDPGEPYAKPKPVKRFRFTFERGSRFDTRALPVCRASDLAVRRLGKRACPSASRVGSGSTQALAGPGIPITTKVTLFNARRRQIIVLVEVAGRTLTEFRDSVRGRTLEVNTVIPTGISLTGLDITIPKHQRRYKGKRRAYFRMPKACPASGMWTTTTTFDYVDGSTQTLASTTPCA
jgi:hypothetical protein